MPVTCDLRDGKHRVVDPDGNIEVNESGTHIDGDGHDTAEQCQAQADAVNASEEDTAAKHRPEDHPEKRGRLSRFSTIAPVGTVDRDAGKLFGVSVITVGEAKGHGEYVDGTMVDQVVELGQRTGTVGLKCRFDHPSACSRAMGTHVGRFHNFRRDGEQARADLTIADAAAASPDGDYRDYILKLAEEDPEAFATSIVFRRGEEEIPDRDNIGKEGFPPEGDPFWLPHPRVLALTHCDVVDQGAANDGLFGRQDYWLEQAERFAIEHPQTLGRIMALHNDWKAKQENKKMSDQNITELTAELKTATDKVESLTAELATAKSTAEGLESAHATALTAAKAEGAKEMSDRVEDRRKKFKNDDFILETIQLSDAEVSDEFITRMQAGTLVSDGGGSVIIPYQEGGNVDEKGTFQEKVHAKVAEGKTRGEAIKLCVKEFPELHAKYKDGLTSTAAG